MSEFDNYFTAETKQSRSDARIERILDAVEDLSTEAPTKKINARSIAKKAFVSIGAVYHHFASIQNIFASLAIRNIRKRQNKLIDLANSIEPDVTVSQMADALIESAFNDWKYMPDAAKKEAVHAFYKSARHPEKIFSYAEELYPYFEELVKRNTTNTFRVIPKDEWPLLNRLSQTAILSPFIEQLPIAGTDVHRRIAKDVFMRLYSK
jgi:AcrR family transcriptional regulator